MSALYQPAPRTKLLIGARHMMPPGYLLLCVSCPFLCEHSPQVPRQSRTAQLNIYRLSDASNDVRNGFDIRLSGMKVHDASTQKIMPVYYGIGDKCLATALNPIKQLTVDRIEIEFDLRISQLQAKIARYVAECCYAQALGHKLQLVMMADRLSHGTRQANVVLDHLAISSGSN